MRHHPSPKFQHIKICKNRSSKVYGKRKTKENVSIQFCDCFNPFVILTDLKKGSRAIPSIVCQKKKTRSPETH